MTGILKCQRCGAVSWFLTDGWAECRKCGFVRWTFGGIPTANQEVEDMKLEKLEDQRRLAQSGVHVIEVALAEYIETHAPDRKNLLTTAAISEDMGLSYGIVEGVLNSNPMFKDMNPKGQYHDWRVVGSEAE